MNLLRATWRQHKQPPANISDKHSDDSYCLDDGDSNT